MTITHYKELNTSQKEFLFQLWNKEYPQRLCFSAIADLDAYLAGFNSADHSLVTTNKNELVAWACVFERANEKWFAMILDGSVHGKGLGSKLLALITENETVLNGWVIDHNNDVKANGDPYPSPLQFYKKNKFITCNETRLETEKLSAIKIQWNSNPTD